MLILFSHRFEVVVYVAHGERSVFEIDNEGLERVFTGRFKECLRTMKSPPHYSNGYIVMKLIPTVKGFCSAVLQPHIGEGMGK